MIRALLDENADDWDQSLPWVLFAYREVPVETLGFPHSSCYFLEQ